jgi:hypothetical protein
VETRFECWVSATERPSIWCCLDHSAGESVRRARPIRSETRATLVAAIMPSVVTDASVVSSSSQRRPRACCGGVPSGRRISRRRQRLPNQVAATLAKICALTLLRRDEEAAKLSEEQHHRIALDGDTFNLVPIEPMQGLHKVLHGDIANGLRILEETIVRRENEGYQSSADWCRVIVAEVYLEIIAGKEKPRFVVLLKNLPILLKVMLTAPSRIPDLITHAVNNAQFEPNGPLAGKSEMILGLLYKAKKKRPLAVQHLTKAQRILSQFGQTPILARVETALAELGQQP